MRKWSLLIPLLFMLGCSNSTSTPPEALSDGAPSAIPVDIAAIPDAVPHFEPKSRTSNPESYEVLGKRYTVLADGKNYKKRGIASWYGTKFHGKNTSNGEVYDMYGMTAAHKTLPIPSYVRVTNLQNRRSIVVRVNDRGPFHENRIIDLSYVAAIKLGIQRAGTGFVEVATIVPGQPSPIANTSKSQTATASNLIFLQVGAFSSQFNAEELKNRIDTTHPTSSRIKTITYQGNTIYKLQLGPIHSTEQADQINTLLAKIGINKTHFIIEKSGH